MTLRFLAIVAAALALAGPAAACAQPRTSLAYLEGQVMCPTCHTTLDQSDSAAARQIEGFIRQKIAACWTAQRIESAVLQRPGRPGQLGGPAQLAFDFLDKLADLGGGGLGLLVLNPDQ